MRVAVISDIHANLPAFEAVLADIERAGIEQVWCLGDIVGYGAEPDACVTLARERCSICLLGNHDLAVLGQIDSFSFTPAAAEAVHWARERMSSESTEFLASLLPARHYQGFGLYHASPRDPVWEYVLSTDQAAECMDVQSERISLIGHSHIALFFHEIAPRPGRPSFRNEAEGAKADPGLELNLNDGARWLLNPGSVGQPRDRDPRSSWLELDISDLVARYHRVAYEIDRAAGAIVAAALPFHLANRLYVGR